MEHFFFLFLLIAAKGYANLCQPAAAAWTDTERQNIAGVHNTLRSSIAKGTYVARTDQKPPATDMEYMYYDCNLEASAQAWANTCPTGHSGSPGKGENIYWSWSSAPISIDGKGVAAANAWQNEFQQYGWPSNILTSSLFNSGIGHATQMAWWSSNHVGCGVKQCPSTMSGMPYEIVVVCQYTPQGNILNQPIYQSGQTCSACPSSMYCSGQGLCLFNVS